MLCASLPPLVLEERNDRLMLDNNICGVCGNPIRVQIQKNTGVYSQVCENKAAKQAINAVTE